MVWLSVISKRSTRWEPKEWKIKPQKDDIFSKFLNIFFYQEVDTYYHINIVETLAYSRYVPMLAQEIKIHPNIKPESSQLFGIDIPGAKRYLVTNILLIQKL